MPPQFREHVTDRAPRVWTYFKRLNRECSRYGAPWCLNPKFSYDAINYLRMSHR